MGYYEGEIGCIGNGYNNNNGFGNGWEGLIGLALVAGLFDGGFGIGGGNSRGGYAAPATQADLAAGFANSEIMSDLNDILLQNSQNTAAIQQTLCQGFSGLNQSLERGIATTNFNMQQCCCDIKSTLLENRYLNEKQTCDLITNANANTQRIIDYMQNEKICALQSENLALKGQISNNAQSAYIISQLNPTPKPAYVVANPNCCYNGCSGCGNF